MLPRECTEAAHDKHAAFHMAGIIKHQHWRDLLQALADWQRATGDERALYRHAVRIYINLYRYAQTRVHQTWAEYIRELRA